MSDTSKSALILLFDGFEEIEAITPIDLLRRAGIKVTSASLSSKTTMVKGRDDITIQADSDLDSIISNNYDCIILPGGPGVTEMRDDPRVINLIQEQSEGGRLIAAICAAPIVLDKAGLLADKKYTAHFATNDVLPKASTDAVVTDEKVITSQGAGTATEFSLEIIKSLLNQNAANEIAASICYHA